MCAHSDKVTTVVSNPDPFSTIAHLHLDRCSLVPKPGHPLNETFEETRARLTALVGVPPLLSEEAEEARLAIEEEYVAGVVPGEVRAARRSEVQAEEVGWMRPTAKRTGDWLSFAEVTAFVEQVLTEGLTLEEEVNACFKNLQSESLVPRCSYITKYAC